MADKCTGCDPNFQAHPASAVYYTGKEYKELGIKEGMPLSDVIMSMADAFLPLLNSTGGKVTESDVIVGTPPKYLSNDFNRCWDRVGSLIGRYSVRPDSSGAQYIFSYDFSEALAKLPDLFYIQKVDTAVYITENGKRKKYTSGSSTSNAFNIDKNSYPVSLDITVNLKSTECSGIQATKSIVVSAFNLGDKQFTFQIGGSADPSITNDYTLKDLNQMIQAKLSGINNYVSDLIASDYASELNTIKAMSQSIIEQSKVEKTFEVGTGINKQVVTMPQAFDYIEGILRGIADKLNILERNRT